MDVYRMLNLSDSEDDHDERPAPRRRAAAEQPKKLKKRRQAEIVPAGDDANETERPEKRRKHKHKQKQPEADADDASEPAGAASDADAGGQEQRAGGARDRPPRPPTWRQIVEEGRSLQQNMLSVGRLYEQLTFFHPAWGPSARCSAANDAGGTDPVRWQPAV